MLRVFIGYDERQPVSFSVLSQSILENASVPVQITPIRLHTLPLKRQGLTPFTYSRFMVPYMCNYKGWGLFLDADMVLLDDIAKLFDKGNTKYKVMVVKNPMKFEWASLMLFNCAKCEILTPDYIEKANNLHGIGWAEDHEIGDLPREWNHLVGYDEEREDAKLVHYTQGVPAFPETQSQEYSKEWHGFAQRALAAVPWDNLMAQSVHATNVNDTFLPKFLFEEDNFTPKPKYKKIVMDLIKEKRKQQDGNAKHNQEQHS